MVYKVIDIYKDLPRRSGCSDCGKPGCFAFATSVHLEGRSITTCPHLADERRSAMEAKIAEARSQGVGPRDAPEAQAARQLQSQVAGADLVALAGPAGVVYEAGPPEALRVWFMARDYLVSRDAVITAEGAEPDVWIKVMLLMYLTRASGTEATGEWVAFRDLPNTISKASSFEKWIDRVGPASSGHLDELVSRASEMGGEVIDERSADLAIRFQLLPRVAARLLVWEADEDFSARASLLLDRNVLDYLDQEALTFLAEAVTRRLVGGSP
jgi:hypothetical protein